VHHDLALLRLAAPLPASLSHPGLGSVGLGEEVTLVGFGRSGYGDYGYLTSASLTDRRSGSNVIDRLDAGMEVFRYDFDDPGRARLLLWRVSTS
jgi:hypothetical protein